MKLEVQIYGVTLCYLFNKPIFYGHSLYRDWNEENWSYLKVKRNGRNRDTIEGYLWSVPGSTIYADSKGNVLYWTKHCLFTIIIIIINLYRDSFLFYLIIFYCFCYFTKYDSSKSPWSRKLGKKKWQRSMAGDYTVAINHSDPRAWQQLCLYTSSRNWGSAVSCLHQCYLLGTRCFETPHELLLFIHLYCQCFYLLMLQSQPGYQALSQCVS